MIRVLHLRDTAVVCGPGKTIIETSCAVDRDSFDLSVGVLCNPTRPNAYVDAVEARSIVVHRIGGRFAWDPRLPALIADLVRRERIHIVHAHDYLSDILTRVVKTIVPVATMSTVHGFITNTLRSRVYVTLSTRALRGLDRVVAVSDETRQRVVATGVPPEKVTVIHNAIVERNYRIENFERGVFRRNIGVRPDAILIGNIGRLSSEKGQKDTLLAAANLIRDDARVHLVFAGGGRDRSMLEALAGELGIADRVTFTGHVGDVRPIYRDLDILALTSYTEGFPNVVLEALCMGVPVLATNVGGVRELMTDDVTGVLVPAGQPPRIEAGLRHLVNAPGDAARMVATGRRRVLEHFEFAARTRQEEAVYRELVDG